MPMASERKLRQMISEAFGARIGSVVWCRTQVRQADVVNSTLLIRKKSRFMPLQLTYLLSDHRCAHHDSESARSARRDMEDNHTCDCPMCTPLCTSTHCTGCRHHDASFRVRGYGYKTDDEEAQGGHRRICERRRKILSCVGHLGEAVGEGIGQMLHDLVRTAHFPQLGPIRSVPSVCSVQNLNLCTFLSLEHILNV